ncbi:box C/D snoRNA protein 1 [Anopheles cruzii]|uniref:box C/D snoRNA protein 1 n=1 Tax=Anopheles cruzii TaxID=68878 RepID=UPI0022EC2026|nr:box C/D snoRNA protein 1 [Anopheles cruzii]
MSSDQRLGNCEACNAHPAKYTCPRCEVRTCGVQCLNIHKRELKCNGIRDRTKYIPLIKMTKTELMNDYCFLEECTRFVEDRKRDSNKRFTRYNKLLPTPLFRLRKAAQERGTTLRFLLQNFTKHQKNSSQLDFRSSVIFWRVEWCFPDGTGAHMFVDERVSENCKLYEAVSKYLQAGNDTNVPESATLTYYQASGINGVRLLLKAEGIKQCRNRFFPLDVNSTIRECLAGKTVVEYPTIYVVFKDRLDEFNVVDSDDDVEGEMRQYQNYINQTYVSTNAEPMRNISTEIIENKLDRMGIDKGTLLNDSRTREQSGQPSKLNYLFSTESALNCSSSDTEDGELTEEEVEMVSPKRTRMLDVETPAPGN